MAIDRKGNASRFGLERGDTILQVNGKEVSNVRTLLGMVGVTPTAWIIRIERDGKESNIVIR